MGVFDMFFRDEAGEAAEILYTMRQYAEEKNRRQPKEQMGIITGRRPL
jgi:hypothetical protein